jgi:hypothetical protein
MLEIGILVSRSTALAVSTAAFACFVVVSVAETSLEASPFCHLPMMHDFVTRFEFTKWNHPNRDWAADECWSFEAQ